MRDTEDRKGARRVALISLLAAVGLILTNGIAGLLSGSLSLLSEAVHATMDAGATLLTYVAIRISAKPPDREHPYGHGKAENIAALLETIFLFILAVFIAREAVERLVAGRADVEATWYVFAVLGLSIVVEATRSRALTKAAKKYRSAALEADALHFTADMMTSILVLVGMVLVRFGFPEADAIGGLVVAAYVAFQSFRLGKRSIDVLMDRAPTGSMIRIEDAAKAVPGVEEVRRVRARFVGGEPQTDVVIAISRTVPLERAHEVTEEVERAIEAAEPGADVVVHVEPLADEKAIREQVIAITARESRVQQIHNISVTVQPDGNHISLHAKFPGSMSLAEAHSIAEAMESEISAEVSNVARVDTHLEPLEPSGAVASDVTGSHDDMVGWIRGFSENQPEVQDCHEVVISESSGSLQVVMHCEAAPGLSVAAVHEASNRIEEAVHRRWPNVGVVTVHFEPARIS